MILLPKEGIISITVLPETMLEDDFIRQEQEALRAQLAKLTVGKKTEKVLEAAYLRVNQLFRRYKAKATAKELIRHQITVKMEDCLE
jgi:hypothetical protein